MTGLTKPDPVVTLFAEWGAIQDEAAALGKADPEGMDAQVNKQHDKLYDQQSAIERQIIDTPATSVGGIAVKLRLLAYIEFPMKGLPDLHRTPAKDTDFKGIIEAWRAGPRRKSRWSPRRGQGRREGDLHRTPVKDTDFKGIIEAWRADVVPDKGLNWQDELLIGSLRDAERLAGVS